MAIDEHDTWRRCKCHECSKRYGDNFFVQIPRKIYIFVSDTPEVKPEYSEPTTIYDDSDDEMPPLEKIKIIEEYKFHDELK